MTRGQALVTANRYGSTVAREVARDIDNGMSPEEALAKQDII